MQTASADALSALVAAGTADDNVEPPRRVQKHMNRCFSCNKKVSSHLNLLLFLTLSAHAGVNAAHHLAYAAAAELAQIACCVTIAGIAYCRVFTVLNASQAMQGDSFCA